jgi:hypothetical protein
VKNADDVKRLRSLIIVAPTPPSKRKFPIFQDKVRAFNSQPPFNFNDPFDNLKIQMVS